MKKIIYTVIVFLCFTNFLWAQDTFIAHAVTLAMPNLGMAIPLGKSNVAHADTSNWRNPQNIDQSVLRFDTNELTSEQKNEKLRLLGFFYNPAVVHFDKKEGKVILNTNRSLYRKNKIEFVYRKFVKQYYENINEYIISHKNNEPIDEDFFLEQFEAAQNEFSREIKE